MKLVYAIFSAALTLTSIPSFADATYSIPSDLVISFKKACVGAGRRNHQPANILAPVCDCIAAHLVSEMSSTKTQQDALASVHWATKFYQPKGLTQNQIEADKYSILDRLGDWAGECRANALHEPWPPADEPSQGTPPESH